MAKYDEVGNIPIVREFLDVFVEDLLGLPPCRETEFTIELILGTTSISIPLYRMASLDLQELRNNYRSC